MLNYYFLPQTLDLASELFLHLKASFFLVLGKLGDFLSDGQYFVADIKELLAENLMKVVVNKGCDHVSDVFDGLLSLDWEGAV